jgi:hypothetical protein
MSSSNPAGGPQQLLQFAFGYAPPLIIETAVRFNLFDQLDSGSKSSEELAKSAQVPERGIRIVLNALVGLQLLQKESDGKYALVPTSKDFLISTRSGYLGGFFKHSSTQLIPKWLQLPEIVKTGKPATAVNQIGDGTDFFQQFVEDIFPLSFKAASELGEALKVKEAKETVRILDLAAGSGVWGIGVAQHCPKATVTAVDWPGVLPVTRRMAERFKMLDRFEFVEGDLSSADFGKGHHIATLGHILHSEGIERSKTLLQKTFGALATGGTIAIAEWLVSDDRTQPAPGLIFAVNMLVNTDVGDTFSFNEIKGWLEAVGFKDVRMLDASGVSPLILATKP